MREQRKLLDLTLESLAERADMNWSYIAQVEHAERNISIDNLAALTAGLGIPLRELL